MVIKVFKNESQRNQHRIKLTLTSLKSLPKVNVTCEETEEWSIPIIRVSHGQEYVPDFELKWCPNKKHYRVYILIADTKHPKENAGYCICTIPNGLAASAFVMFYGFLHKYRANNKSAAE